MKSNEILSVVDSLLFFKDFFTKDSFLSSSSGLKKLCLRFNDIKIFGFFYRGFGEDWLCLARSGFELLKKCNFQSGRGLIKHILNDYEMTSFECFKDGTSKFTIVFRFRGECIFLMWNLANLFALAHATLVFNRLYFIGILSKFLGFLLKATQLLFCQCFDLVSPKKNSAMLFIKLFCIYIRCKSKAFRALERSKLIVFCGYTNASRSLSMIFLGRSGCVN